MNSIIYCLSKFCIVFEQILDLKVSKNDLKQTKFLLKII